MDEFVFATATWARTPEERGIILSSLKALSGFGFKIVIGDKADSAFPLANDFAEIRGAAVFSGETFDAQRRKAYTESSKIGKNIFWMESDKGFFMENKLKKILKEKTGGGRIVFPFPDKTSFGEYPPFQMLIEDCLNRLIRAYIPGDGHFTYGPMLFPSELVKYLGMSDKKLGWGMNIFLAMIGSAKGMPIEYAEVDAPHDRDVQEGEALKRFRLEQVADYIRSMQEASEILEKNK